MKKKGFALLLILTATLVLSGCATIQTMPVKTAPRESFNKPFPETIVIAPLDCGPIYYEERLKGKTKAKEEFSKKLREEYKKIDPKVFEKARKIISRMFKKRFPEPEFKISTKAPLNQPYILVKMTIGERGIGLAGLLAYGQYADTMVTLLKVAKMPKGTVLLEHRARTEKLWMFWSRTLFYNAVKASADRAAGVLKKKLRAGK